MEKEIGIICAEGLSFFGITNRLISHELKNIFAIIFETLGLIDELMELAEAGRKLEAGKLRSLSESTIEEIERANAIIGSMNTFAHSVDEFIVEVDINQTVALMIKLSKLNSLSKNTEIHLAKTDAFIVYSSPFFLLYLLNQAMNFALACAGPNKKIQVSLHPMINAIRITFSGIAVNSGSFPTKKPEILAKAISAEISLDAAAGELHIELPQRISESLIQNLFSDQ